jgi:hypothetical protein
MTAVRWNRKWATESAIGNQGAAKLNRIRNPAKAAAIETVALKILQNMKAISLEMPENLLTWHPLSAKFVLLMAADSYLSPV